MVGVIVVGELVWLVENMLNCVFDKNIEMIMEVIGIVEWVIEVILQLVKVFEDWVKFDIDVDFLVAVVDVLVKGEILLLLLVDFCLDVVVFVLEEVLLVVEEILEVEVELLVFEIFGFEELELEIDFVFVDIFSQEVFFYLEMLKIYLNNELV